MAQTIFRFGSTLELDSTELKRVRCRRNVVINSVETLALYELTSVGVLRATRFEIQATIRLGASIQFTLWNNQLNAKTTETLTILARNWGNFYLENTDYDVIDIAQDGDILTMDLSASFVGGVNF